MNKTIQGESASGNKSVDGLHDMQTGWILVADPCSSMTPKRKKQSPLLNKTKVSKSIEAEQEFLANVVRGLFIKKGVSLCWTAVSLLGDDMAYTIGAPEPFERAVLELCLIVKADSTAKAALFLPLLGDDLHDYKRLYKALNKLGVYDHQVPHWRFPQFTFTAFDARPLIAILKKMPGRDAQTGLSKGCPYTEKFNSVLKLIREGSRCRIAKKNNWLFPDKNN